jgi:NAD(P)H-hydrate epimerase
VEDEAAWVDLRPEVLGADLVVDALLGTGLSRAPSGLIGRVIADLERDGPSAVVSIDLPSGVSSDSGVLPGGAVRAALTVALAAPKYGHVLPPGCDRVGELRVADIGIPRSVLDAAAESPLGLLEDADAEAAFPPRAAAAHKGDYGHVLVIAGSVGKSGAAILAGLGALRAGAGLVTVATPAPALPLVAMGRPEMMTEPLGVGPGGGLDREALKRALALAAGRDAAVIGPGLGQDPDTADFVRSFVRECAVPLVVDADGLNALAASPEGVAPARSAATVLTPHPGEMARLSGSTSAEVQGGRLSAARALAARVGAFVVLKGHGTIVADPDGGAAVNPTGNPGMATGGTGDVLSGVIGALLARRCAAWLAATAGVFVHGRAGDLAAARLGQDAMLAGDLADALPEAIRSLASSRA